jgi:hypothetical protein
MEARAEAVAITARPTAAARTAARGATVAGGTRRRVLLLNAATCRHGNPPLQHNAFLYR